MTKAAVIRQLVSRTKSDFVSYFASCSETSEAAAQFSTWAESADARLSGCAEQIEGMLPDTEDDGSWEASYALNAGLIMLCLIQFEAGQEQAYEEAVSLFFDTAHFKVLQATPAAGLHRLTQSEIASHELMEAATAWFKQIGGTGR